MAELYRTIVAGYTGTAFVVKEGQYVTVKDVEGDQICDFVAFNEHDYTKRLSVAHTRMYMRRNYVHVGDTFYTWDAEEMFTMVEDTVGVHDVTFPSCDAPTYEELGLPDHPSCRGNFIKVLAPYGIEDWMLPDPFNIFMNSPNMELFPNRSKAGDYVKLKFHMDALVALTACSYDLDGMNGGKSTPLEIVVTDE